MYPGDPSADAENIYNCRCTLVAAVEGVNIDYSDTSLRHNANLGNMTYDEWKKEKKSYSDKITKQDDIAENVRKEYNIKYSEIANLPEYGSKMGDIIIHEAEVDNVEYIKPEKLSKPLTTDEIINKISGGDMTEGSCASVALCYIGNKNGYDVRDFRGGKSRSLFSTVRNQKAIANLEGVKSYIVNDTNDYIAVKELLKNTVNGKEYLLSTGNHVAIIRKNEKIYEYMELQDPYYNGYKRLTNNTLKERFKCKKTHSTYGVELGIDNVLIDIETLYDNEEFNNILGYINTAESKQKKGVSGHVK